MNDTPIMRIIDNDNEMYVKRDDLLPFSFGGNKVRIANIFIDDMKNRHKNCMVGYGNSRSNLSRALSNICYQQEIPCHIISPADDDGVRVDTFNSRIVKSCGAIFHYCDKDKVRETIENVLRDLIIQGYDPYYIYGDSIGAGNEQTPLKAYAQVYEDIRGKFDYIFLATGTGMTQGGLLAGQALYGGKEKIIGISVARDSEKEVEIIRKSLESYSEKVESIKIPSITVLDDYICGGYGKCNNGIEDTINIQMKVNGLPLDPTYTGKAFYGMSEYLKKNNIKGKKILFIHTGGTPLYFDYLLKLHLKSPGNSDSVYDAVSRLEGKLTPSLSCRNINLRQYSNKLFDNGRVWIHYDIEKPISIIAGYFNDNNTKIAYLSMLAVEDEYRGKHLASELMSEFEDYANKTGMQSVKLEVRKNNDVALTFYKKHKYKIIGEASESSYYMIKNI